MCLEQPPLWEHTSVDGIFIKQMLLKAAGTAIPQHAHAYDHTSMLARGRIRAWSGDELMGEFEAPCPIFIKAHIKHTFLSLENDTLIYCIHNAGRTGAVEVVEEHQFAADSIPRRRA